MRRLGRVERHHGEPARRAHRRPGDRAGRRRDPHRSAGDVRGRAAADEPGGRRDRVSADRHPDQRFQGLLHPPRAADLREPVAGQRRGGPDHARREIAGRDPERRPSRRDAGAAVRRARGDGSGRSGAARIARERRRVVHGPGRERRHRAALHDGPRHPARFPRAHAQDLVQHRDCREEAALDRSQRGSVPRRYRDDGPARGRAVRTDPRRGVRAEARQQREARLPRDRDLERRRHTVTSTAAVAAARALLGLGESANFPGAIKSVGQWFPKEERALATGIFNAGTNTGAILTPLIVPLIALNWGWRWAFVVTGSLGFLWLFLWLALYRSPSHEAPTPSPEPRVPWLRLLTVRQTWAIVAGKFLADPVWWFYLYWLPKFLDRTYGVKLAQVALPLITVYVIADVGSIGGGWLSSSLIKRGWTVNRARKTAMLLMALAIVPTALAPRVGSLWGAVLIISLAAAAHQGWSANVYTLASDMFPPSAVASVSGIGGFAGAMGGVLFQLLTGLILDATGGNYASIFAVCGFAYVTAWTIIHLLAPRLEPVEVR